MKRAGPRGLVIVLMPPLSISMTELRFLLMVLAKSIRDVTEGKWRFNLNERSRILGSGFAY